MTEYEKIYKDTYIIKEGEGPGKVYMYLLVGKGRAILIDSGYGKIDLKRICNEITDLPIDLLLTHGHFDHVGGVNAFENVWISFLDYDLLHNTIGKVNGNLYDIKDNQLFDIGGRCLKAISVPGHTKGCVAYLDMNNRVLFSGDICCKADVLLNFEESDTIDIYMNSLRKLIKMENEYDYNYPSHHSYPIEKEILRDIEVCGVRIISKSYPAEVVEMMGRKYKKMRNNDVAIVY